MMTEQMEQPAVKPRRNYHCIGKYEVLAHVATGGMGVIYRARDMETGAEVALKVLSPALTSQKVALERFEREARRGAKLRHENIVAIYELGQTNFGEAFDTRYIALEYVEGVDLHEYVNRSGPLDPSEAMPIFRQAARALEYLHSQHVVHRDVKPSNFLLTWRDGEPLLKLTDLGLARELTADEFRVTRSGNTVGTVDYMAPEQARDAGSADIRSDIYSLGCTFYHILAGHPPYPEGGLTERLYKHAEAPIPDIRDVSPAVSAALTNILVRMMAKRPADRYQTPQELLDDLDTVERGEAVTPAEKPRRPQAPELPPRPPSPRPTTPAESSWQGVTQDGLAAQANLTSLGVSRGHRQVAAGQFKRAHDVLVEDNYDYGIHLLLSCCRLDPANLIYRQTLRRIERLRTPEPHRLAWLTGLTARARFKAARHQQNHLKVLEYGEKVLTRDPWDVPIQMDMADAAIQLGLLNLAVWILEQAWQKETHTPALNEALARLYEKRGFYSEATALWNLILKADPDNRDARKKLKDLAARDTIARGQYKELVENGNEK